MKIVIASLALFCLGGCSSSDSTKSLEEYAMELPAAINNGKNVHAYVSTSKGLSPEIRLAQHYNDLIKRWVYYPDPPGYDSFSVVEELHGKDQLKGDCEDFAASLIAIC